MPNTPPTSASELLRRYAAGEREFVGTEWDMPDADLRGVTLEGANLSRSYIVAHFQGTNLARVNFTDANIKTCDFRNANLRDAIFCGALLESTEFGGADMTGADFTGARYYTDILRAGETPNW